MHPNGLKRLLFHRCQRLGPVLWTGARRAGTLLAVLFIALLGEADRFLVQGG